LIGFDIFWTELVQFTLYVIWVIGLPLLETQCYKTQVDTSDQSKGLKQTASFDQKGLRIASWASNFSDWKSCVLFCIWFLLIQKGWFEIKIRFLEFV